jgi:hypothetical protein
MSLEPASATGRECVAAALGAAGAASRRDHDGPSRSRASADSRRQVRRAPSGKPVPFARALPTPFLDRGPGKQAVEQPSGPFPAWNCDAPKERPSRTRSGNRCRAKAASGSPPTYMLRSRAPASRSGAGGPAFRGNYSPSSRARAYHAYNAPLPVRRGDARRAIEWAEKVPGGSVPKAEAELVRIDALRTLSPLDRRDGAGKLLQRVAERPRHAGRCSRRRGDREAIARRRRRARRARRHRHLPARVGRSAAGAWGDRRGTWADRRHPAHRGGVARARTNGCRAGWAVQRNRNQSQAAFTPRWRLPAWMRTGMPRALPSPQSVTKQRQRPRDAAALRRGRGRLRAGGEPRPHAKALYQGARCCDGGKKRPRAGAVRAVEAETRGPQLRRRRTHPVTEARDRRRRQGTAKLLAEVPTLSEGDLLNRAWRLAFTAWRAGPRRRRAPLARREPAAVPTRGSGTPRGAPILKGACSSRANQRRRAPGTSGRAQTRCRSMPLLSLTRLKTLDPGAKALIETLRRPARRPRLDVPARPLYGDAGFLRRRTRPDGSGGRRPPRARQVRLVLRRKHASGAPRTRTSSGSRRRCSIAAASGTRRTRCRGTR